jgi:hypothetical protein
VAFPDAVSRTNLWHAIGSPTIERCESKSGGLKRQNVVTNSEKPLKPQQSFFELVRISDAEVQG